MAFLFPVCRERQRAGKMGNAKSLDQKTGSRFLPEEQAEVDRLFDALSSSEGSVAKGTFSLEALKARATTFFWGGARGFRVCSCAKHLKAVFR